MAQTKAKQIRVRVNEAQDAHLRQAAIDAGYEDFSSYVRDVLLSSHVVVVARPVIVIPAHTAEKAEREEFVEIVGAVVRGIEESGQAAPQSPPPGPAPGAPSSAPVAGGASPGDAPPPAGAEVPHASAAPPAPETSPGPVDGSVGTTASQEIPPPDAADPSQSAAPDTVEGSVPGSEEVSDAELAARQAAAEQLLSPNPPLGPTLQPGETAEAYISRRTVELKDAGRPTIVAGYEAEAEFRRVVGELAAEQAGQAPSATLPPPQPQPTPGPTACGRCGALKRNPGPCPDCGAPA